MFAPSTLILLGLSVFTKVSSGSVLVERAGTCAADNCYRAVKALSAFPFSSSASQDCVSFLRTTVTPCTETSTATVTSNSVAPVVTITTASTSTQMVQNTLTEVQTYIVTTVTLSPTVTIPATAYATVTSDTITVTETTYVAQITTQDLVQRAILSCQRTTATPTAVPTYASACSGTVRYSSACSCVGVSAVVTTVLAPTTVITSTTISVSTPTTTSTSVVTLVSTAQNTVTQIIQSTLTITLDTSSITSYTTSILSQTATLTATVTSFVPCKSISIVVLSVTNAFNNCADAVAAASLAALIRE